MKPETQNVVYFYYISNLMIEIYANKCTNKYEQNYQLKARVTQFNYKIITPDE